MDVLKDEDRKLTESIRKRAGICKEIVTIKANIDTLLGYTELGRRQEKER